MAQSSHSTVVLARIAGPLLALSGPALIARPAIIPHLIDSFAADPAAPLLWGFIALLLGLTVLAFHQRWNGPLEIAITLLGWVLILRGIVLFFIPEIGIGIARSMLAAAPNAVAVIGAVTTVLGAWLSYEGFRTKISDTRP
jgi:hypothetical protein